MGGGETKRVELKGDIGAKTRKTMPKHSRGPPARRGGGWRGEKTTNARNGRCHYLQSLEGEKCLAENIARIQHNKITNSPVSRYEGTEGALVTPQLGAEEGDDKAQFELTQKNDSPVPQIATSLSRPWPDTERWGSAGLKRKR